MNRAVRGNLKMFPIPGSTQVLDRQSMQLLNCTPALCKASSELRVGAVPGQTTTRHIEQPVNHVTARVLHAAMLAVFPSGSATVQQTAFDFIAHVGEAVGYAFGTLCICNAILLVMIPGPCMT